MKDINRLEITIEELKELKNLLLKSDTKITAEILGAVLDKIIFSLKEISGLIIDRNIKEVELDKKTTLITNYLKENNKHERKVNS